MLKYPFKILIKIRKKRASKNYPFLLITNLACPRLNIKENIYISIHFQSSNVIDLGTSNMEITESV